MTHGIVASSSLRIAVATLAYLISCLTGCASSPDQPGSLSPRSQITVSPPDIFLSAGSSSYSGSRLGVVSFAEPSHLRGVSEPVTVAYYQELFKAEIFSSIQLVRETFGSMEDTLKLAQLRGCDVVLLGNVLEVSDGSGAQECSIEIAIQALDTHSGRTLWYLQQHAFSTPGKDVDLYWITLPGENGQRYKVLARLLAQQLARLLTTTTAGT